VAITYTDNLTLPIVPADNQDWASDYNTMIEKLDRNPGIRIVADEAAMVALTTFTGRMCWRTDLGQYWYYDGTQWAVLPGQVEGEMPAFMPMKGTEQEVTAEVAAEGSQDGTIDFDYYPGVGEEVQLYMLKVTLDADEVPVENEEVIMEEETAKRLEHKHDRSLDETGDEVDNLVVKADGETAEIQTLFLGGATGGTYDLGITGNMATLNHDDTAATIQTALEGIFGAGNVTVVPDTDFTITFAVSVGDSNLIADFTGLTGATDPALTVTQAYSAHTVYVRDTDYAVTVDSSGYTNIARIALGSITDPETVLVDYDYQPGVSGFKFKLYSEAARTNLMYELDTEQDPDWPGGIAIRDPNYGYLPICYFVDEDENGQFYYRVENLDEALASRFKVDIKYKALT